MLNPLSRQRPQVWILVAALVVLAAIATFGGRHAAAGVARSGSEVGATPKTIEEKEKERALMELMSTFSKPADIYFTAASLDAGKPSLTAVQVEGVEDVLGQRFLRGVKSDKTIVLFNPAQVTAFVLKP